MPLLRCGRSWSRVWVTSSRAPWRLPNRRWPQSVRRTLRGSRSNSGTPSQLSRPRIWWDTAVGVTASSSAAALKLDRRAADSKLRRAVSGRLANMEGSMGELDSSG
ncbi:hypothetical protein D3C76_1351610 [compost metagenome]